MLPTPTEIMNKNLCAIEKILTYDVTHRADSRHRIQEGDTDPDRENCILLPQHLPAFAPVLLTPNQITDDEIKRTDQRHDLAC